MAVSNGITREEKVRARHHLAYLNVASVYTFVLGTPAAVETQFLIEGAFDRVLVDAVPLFREILGHLDAVDEQRKELLDTLVADRVGQIELSKDRMKAIAAEHEHWAGRLANLLGAPPNPFDKSAGAGVNVRVQHG